MDLKSILELELELEKDKYFFRNMTLDMCKSEDEKMRYREMWSKEDNAEKIARAIRYSSLNQRHRFLGIF